MPRMESNALALEYQRDYGNARWNLKVTDLVNNTIPVGVCHVFGPGFSEEVLDFGFGDLGSLHNNAPDSLLIAE